MWSWVTTLKRQKGRRQKPYRSCVTLSPPSRLISSSDWDVELLSVVHSDTVYVRSPDWKSSHIWLIDTPPWWFASIACTCSRNVWTEGTSGQILIDLTGLQITVEYCLCDIMNILQYIMDEIKKIIHTIERSSHGISITHCLIVTKLRLEIYFELLHVSVCSLHLRQKCHFFSPGVVTTAINVPFGPPLTFLTHNYSAKKNGII